MDGDKSRNGLGVGQRGVDKTTQAFRHRRRDAIVAKQNTTTTTATRKSCVVEQISDRAINFSRGQEEVTGKNACGGCKGGDKPSSKANLADNNGVAPVKKERDSAARGKANLAGRENADVLLEVDVDSEGRGKADGFAEGWEGARNDDLIMEVSWKVKVESCLADIVTCSSLCCLLPSIEDREWYHAEASAAMLDRLLVWRRPVNAIRTKA